MAGGKETPRQKMIGMMYLVLTALLALNVSKQVIGAFITLNDKVDVSTGAIETKNGGIYEGFQQKILALKSTGGDTKEIKKWQSTALKVKQQADESVDFLINSANDMIKKAEGGKDWIDHSSDIKSTDKSYVTALLPLSTIQNYDNYDIPTNMFVGGNIHQPKPKGLLIRESLIKFRNQICNLIGNYSVGSKKYEFKSPNSIDALSQSFQQSKVNPEDTAKIRHIYNILSYPSEVLNRDGEKVPWVSAMFDHSPIVAAVAMFTALKSDVRNAESIAIEHMLAKVDAPTFNFNKIEPMAFAPATYLNIGDSIPLLVKIAAYDSTDKNKITFGFDNDTLNPSTWNETEGVIGIKASQPGKHKVKGNIYVQQKGEMIAKPWEFSYTVGAPMGVVSLPNMRVFYWGIDNVVEGTASGFPADKVSLRGTGCSLSSTGNGKYKVRVNRGVRNATISVIGTRDDGTTVNLGSFPFVCKPTPNAVISLSGIKNGDIVSYQKARNASKVSGLLDPSVPLTNVSYKIKKGTLKVEGLPGTGRVLNSGTLDSRAKQLLRMSRGKSVFVIVDYTPPEGGTKKGGINFTVRQ